MGKRLVFMGTPEFAVESLRQLHGRFDVAAVVTVPDKPMGRGLRQGISAVKQFALDNGLPVLQPVKLKDPEFLEALRACEADLFVVVAFRILPEEVWNMPPLGTINLHASLLPDYRGAAPINHAVMNGETVTGVTTFLLNRGVDTGSLLDREEIAIHPADTAGDVHDRLMHTGSRLLVKTVSDMFAGNHTPKPQPAAGSPKVAPRIFRDDCRIDWSTDAVRIHNKIRGLSPYPAAWTMLEYSDGKETEIKLLESRLTEAATNGEPGKVNILPDRVFVHTGNGMLEIIRLKPAGKKEMAAGEFLRGTQGKSFKLR